jgi:hypothetical protein
MVFGSFSIMHQVSIDQSLVGVVRARIFSNKLWLNQYKYERSHYFFRF